MYGVLHPLSRNKTLIVRQAGEAGESVAPVEGLRCDVVLEDRGARCGKHQLEALLGVATCLSSLPPIGKILDEGDEEGGLGGRTTRDRHNDPRVDDRAVRTGESFLEPVARDLAGSETLVHLETARQIVWERDLQECLSEELLSR